jgi:hypothetical protein
MNVYLVPVGADRYELYCEIPEDPEDADDSPGLFRRLTNRFHEMIAEAERERRQGTPPGEGRGWLSRVRARTLRWVAESIAEQRLLWHMRHQTTAVLHYPDDTDEDQAVKILRQQLARDYDKHRFWLVIDSLLTLAAWPLSFVPGPNFLLYFFIFRIVGHYLSLRGAKRGLSVVEWRCHPSAPLAELRKLLTLDPVVRESRVQAVAATLRLEHLESFFQRSAVST